MTATKEAIVAAIERELSAGDIDNAHGITPENIREHLVEPRRETCIVIGDETSELDLWVVLEEDPVHLRGYRVTYDPTTASFGLAFTDVEGRRLYLGSYGSFLQALNAM